MRWPPRWGVLAPYLRIASANTKSIRRTLLRTTPLFPHGGLSVDKASQEQREAARFEEQGWFGVPLTNKDNTRPGADESKLEDQTWIDGWIAGRNDALS